MVIQRGGPSIFIHTLKNVEYLLRKSIILIRCICKIWGVYGDCRLNSIFPFLFMMLSLYMYHVTDCPDDFFGVSCGTPCNCRSSCSNINGECSTQDCYQGWIGSDCQIGT